MAVLDPMNRRGAVLFSGGRVEGRRGNLLAMFNGADDAVPPVVRPDKNGRYRVSSLKRKGTAAAGQRLIFDVKGYGRVDLRLIGSFSNFVRHGRPKLTADVMSFRTVRGSMYVIRND